MNWAGKQHPIETLTEWCAPVVLAGAVGWSAKLAGVAVPIAAIAAAAAFVVGFSAIRLVGGRGAAEISAFEPVPFDADPSHADELLLDDPLIDPTEDSRVVRLFAKQEPTPGELVLRIEDFLSDGARSALPRPDAEIRTSAIPDAGAALQAALANVRASLK